MIESHEELLRRPAVERRTGLSRSTLYALVARGEFPPSIRITARAVAWTRSSVDRWIADRITAHSASPGT